MSNEVVLKAIGISKSFGDHLVVDDVSLEVRRSETVCIVGPSGGGKTTFLRCLNHLERPDSGAVWLDGELLGYRQQGKHLQELPARAAQEQRRHLGMVFQQFNLFPHMTALENVALGPIKVLKKEKRPAYQEAAAWLERVGLADKVSSRPAQLSGGQQQRVGIARMLAMRPKVMLFDEPTSALDPEMVSEVLEVIRDLAQQGTTMVIVTHEIGFAREVADRFVFMESSRVVEHGDTSRLDSTAAEHVRTREFLAKVL